MLLGLARGAPWARWAYNHFGLGNSEVIYYTSVVCVGELLALADGDFEHLDGVWLHYERVDQAATPDCSRLR